MSFRLNPGQFAVFTVILALSAAPAMAQFNIGGTVSDPGAFPVANVELRLYDGLGTAIGIPLTLTDVAGSYSIGPLPSGDYLVEFRPPVATHLSAAELPVTIAGASATLDASLEIGVVVSGFVRDIHGVGIANIDLQARDRSTGELALTPGDDTDLTGFYDVVVPAGEYDFEWRAVAAGSLPWIPVTVRQDVLVDTTIDVTMFLGNRVSGTILDGLGLPVAGVNLDFVDAVTGVKADTPGDNTLADGSFTALVPDGVYDLRVKPSNASRLLAQEIFAFPVSADTSGIDFTLQPGVLLSGTITQAGAIAVPGVEVLYEDPLTRDTPYVPFNTSDPAGFYQIVVPTQAINLIVEPNLGTGLAPKRIGPFSIATDSLLDILLEPGMSVSGTIHDDLMLGIAGVDLDVNDAVTGISLPLVGDGTDAVGMFNFLVPPGNYVIDVEPPPALGFVAQKLGPMLINGPTPLDITLLRGITVEGTVRDGGATPLANVNVDVRRSLDAVEIFTPGDHSDATGFYRVVVPADSYDLIYRPAPDPALVDSLLLADELVFVNRVIDVSIPASTPVSAPRAPGIALAAELLAPWPNPFNPSTNIAFRLGSPTHVQLSIHSVSGALVRTLLDGPLAAGEYRLRWDGTDDGGAEVASSLYFARLRAGEISRSRKLLLVK